MISVSSTFFGGNDTPTAYILIDMPITNISPNGPWDALTVTDRRIVTGANPPNAHATAEATVKAFGTL